MHIFGADNICEIIVLWGVATIVVVFVAAVEVVVLVAVDPNCAERSNNNKHK